eukprot:SAG11_NODE_148_length_14747_cov_217.933517_12_plen_610_part_00
MQKKYRDEIIEVDSNFDNLSLKEKKEIILEKYKAIKQSKSNQPVELNLDYLAQTAANLDDSAIQLAKDTITPFLQPIQTAKTLGALGASVINLALPEKYEIGDKGEEMANAVGDYFSDRYGSIDNVKKSFRDDPLGVASDVASVMSLGLLGAGKLGKIAKIADAETLNTLQKTSGKIDLIDPTWWITKGAEKTIGAGAGAVRKTLTGAADFYSGAPVIGKTYEAARRSPLESQAITEGRRGQVNPNDIVDTIKERALGKGGLFDRAKNVGTRLKDRAFLENDIVNREPISATIQTPRKDLSTGQEDLSTPVIKEDVIDVEVNKVTPSRVQGNYENILKKWQDQKTSKRYFYESETGDVDLTNPINVNDNVAKTIDNVDNMLRDFLEKGTPPTLRNLDALKRNMDKLIDQNGELDILTKVKENIKQEIVSADKTGEYAKSMKAYEEAYKLRNILDKDMSLKNKTSLQSYNKIKKVFSDNPDYDFGIIQDTIDAIDSNRTIRGQMLGEAAQKTVPPMQGTALNLARVGSGIGLASVNPALGLAAITGLSSPRIASSTAQLLGKTRRALDPITTRATKLGQAGRLLQSGLNPAQETDSDEYRGLLTGILGLK